MSESVYLTKGSVLQEFLDLLEAQEKLPPELKREALADPANETKFCEGLEALGTLPVNEDDGEMYVRVGKHHLRLRQLLCDIALAGVGIIIVSASGVPVTWGLVNPKLLSIGTTLYNCLKELDDSEVQVCNAVAHIQRNAVGPGGALKLDPRIPIGTKEDIETWFERRKELVPEGLPDILDRLCRRNVLMKQTLRGKTAYTMIW